MTSTAEKRVDPSLLKNGHVLFRGVPVSEIDFAAFTSSSDICRAIDDLWIGVNQAEREGTLDDGSVGANGMVAVFGQEFHKALLETQDALQKEEDRRRTIRIDDAEYPQLAQVDLYWKGWGSDDSAWVVQTDKGPALVVGAGGSFHGKFHSKKFLADFLPDYADVIVDIERALARADDASISKKDRKGSTIKVGDKTCHSIISFTLIWSGWELDNNAWLVADGDQLRFVTSDHGRLDFTPRPQIEDLLVKYKKVAEDTQAVLTMLA